MPFNQTDFINKYTKELKQATGFDQNAFVDKYANQKLPAETFSQDDFVKKYNTPVMNRGLNDSQSLYQLASQLGLKNQADKILASKGERPEEIFSGGFISDIFDALNALQYGVVGLLKGKGFAEGVKTRQSWSDEDALGDNGLPGIVAGIALDIASDPLTYIAPWTILKKVGIAPKIIKAGEAALEGNKVGQWFGRKFVNKFGLPAPFGEAYDRSIKNTQILANHLNNLVMSTGMKNIPKEKWDKIFTIGSDFRIKRAPLEELQTILSPEEFISISKAYKLQDLMSKEAAELGIVSGKTVEENLGEYIKNYYPKYELAERKGIGGFLKTVVRGVKTRKEEFIPGKTAELTPIKNPSFVFFKSIFDLARDVENAKLYKFTAENFGSAVQKEGYEPLFMYGGKLKFFKGKFTPGEDILKQINLQNFSQGATVPQVLEQSFTKVGKAIQYAEEVGLDVSKWSRGRVMLGRATLGGIEKGGVVQLRAFISDTIAHELGHSFDVDLSKAVNTSRVFQKELSKIVDFMGLGGGEKYRRSAVERFAEFISLYIHNPKKAFELAPEFSKHFETEIMPNNKVSELVNKLSDFFQKVDKLPNIKTPLKELDNANYLETAIRKAFPEKSYIGVRKELPLAYVPKNINEYLTEISRPIDNGFGKKIVAGFKFGKVILNPSTHARNILSNMGLNWWKLGMNPLDPRSINSQKIAIGEIFKGGGEWIEKFKPMGYNLNTFQFNEIKALLDGGEAKGIIHKLGKFLPITPREGLGKKMADLYQGEENFAKLSAAIFNTKYKGMGIEEAWKAAESATFNYAQVTPFIRRLRESLFGFPFITFTYKATPLAVETAFKAPLRISVFGKIKNAIEEASDIKETEREKASEPAWIRDGFYVKLPMKDKHGRSAYFDLSYIIPFGDLVSGNFFTRQVKRETGVQESLAASALERNPVLNLIKEISRNQDFYGDKIWKESDSQEQQLGDLFRHIIKTYAPPLLADQLPGGYKNNLERRQKGFIGVSGASAENQQRTLMEELLRTIGAKIQPIDTDIQDTYMEWEKRKALQTLLLESGVLKEFSQMYIPR